MARAGRLGAMEVEIERCSVCSAQKRVVSRHLAVDGGRQPETTEAVTERKASTMNFAA